MGKGGDGMRKLGGLEALAGLHQAMGGERADLPPDSQEPKAVMARVCSTFPATRKPARARR